MTDVHCTNCGRELGVFEDVVLVACGTVAPLIGKEWVAQESDGPYLHILCKTCAEGLEIAGVVMEEALAQECPSGVRLEKFHACSICDSCEEFCPY